MGRVISNASVVVAAHPFVMLQRGGEEIASYALAVSLVVLLAVGSVCIYTQCGGGDDYDAPTSPVIQHAYGHGLGLDRISPVSISGHPNIDVLVEMPQQITGSSERITVTAKETSTGQSPDGNITYLLGVSHGGKTVFRDYFVAADDDDGILRLDVTVAPSGTAAVDSGPVIIVGEKSDGAPSAWHPAAGHDAVIIKNTEFGSKAGLYTFDIQVHKIGNLADATGDPKTYYADLSIVESASHMQSEIPDYGMVEFGTKSYFDTVQSVVYDADAAEVTVKMPFDWRETRMSHIPVVHVETHFPKTFLDFFSPGYVGYANNVKLFKSSVITDDYTLQDERIVHFVLLQDHLRLVKNEIKESGDPLPDYIEFKLVKADKLEFPLVAYTLSEDFLVNLAWDPPEIQPGEETTFIFTIRDGKTGEPLRNSDYTFVIEQSGQEIHKTSGQARIGGQFVKFTFGEEQTGPTSIKFENIRGTGQETEFGILVVPEFGPLIIMIILVGATAVAVAAPLWYNKRRALLYYDENVTSTHTLSHTRS